MLACQVRYREMGQAAGNSAKARADGFHRQLQQESRDRRAQHGNDCSRNPVGEGATQQHRRYRGSREQCRGQRKRGSGIGEGFHPQPEFAGNFGQLQAKEIFDLGAGDQHRDAIGKTDHNRARNKFHRGAHAGGAQHNEDGARHDGAHVQAVNAMHGDDPRDHDDESAGGSANLSLRSAQRGDQKAGDHGAVDAGLGRESRCDGKGHGQRQSHQPDRDSCDDVFQKLVQTVVTETNDGLGQPTVVQL